MQHYPRASELLPHGDGFRFVDSILSVDDRRIVARRDVPLLEFWTRDHFPGNALVPGVLLLEGMAQAAGLLLRLRRGASDAEVEPRLAGVRSAEFRREARPGDVLTYTMNLKAQIGDLAVCDGSTDAGSSRIASATLVIAIRRVTAGRA